MKFQEAGRLVAGDHVYIFVSDRYPRLLDRLFASRTEVDPEDAEFFGSFAIDPVRPAADLEAAYGPALTEAERKMTIGALVVARLGGRAEYADRVVLGPIELIGEMLDRLRALYRRVSRRKPVEGTAEAAEQDPAPERPG